MSDQQSSQEELAAHLRQHLHLNSSPSIPASSSPPAELKNPAGDDDDEKFTGDDLPPFHSSPAAEAADCEEEEEDEELSDVETKVDLGFVSAPPHPLRLTRPYFPSKVGGRPSWLNPLHLPPSSSLTCPVCGDVLAFLMQLYAPLRDVPHLFHRTLFLFLCPRQSCLSRHSRASPTVICYRSQLPRVNRFYSDQPAQKLGKREGRLEELVEADYEGVHLCVVCGLRGSSVCSGCKALWYCGKRCQKRDWKLGHKAECSPVTPTTPSSSSTPPPFLPPSTQRTVARSLTLFPCYELTYETEYIPSTSTLPTPHEADLLSAYHTRPPSPDPDNADDDDDGLSSLGHLHQHDALFNRFRRRIAHNPEQVVRYERGGEELWVGREGQGEGGGGVCEACGGRRVFELQVLPQLLYYLEREEGGVRGEGEDDRLAAMRAWKEGLDWGSLFVYTCEQSCGNGEEEYRKEWVHLQPHSQQSAQPPQQR